MKNLKALVLIPLLLTQCANVRSEEAENPLEDANLWLKGIEGIQLQESESGEVALKGKIYRKSDHERIQKFLKKYPRVKNEARLSDRISPKHASKSRGGIQPSIYFEMILAEIKKSALDKLGTRLQSPVGVSSNLNLEFLSSKSKSLNLTSDPIRGFLDFAVQAGDGRIHSKQALVIENGKLGQFHVGGEFPIKVVGLHTSRVEFKDFGFIIKCLPRLQTPPFIHLQIDAEISDIDSGGSVDGLPVISKKHLKTQVSARLNEMVALGGMLRTVESKVRDAVPGLHLIPGLGRLFESEDFKEHKSEAYIFISPRKLTEGWVPE